MPNDGRLLEQASLNTGKCFEKVITRQSRDCDCCHRGLDAFQAIFSWSPGRNPPLGGVKYSKGGNSRVSMTSPMLLTPRQAAEKLGMSYPAIKHWILAGRIQTVKTPGGHHRIPLAALDKFLPASQLQSSPAPNGVTSAGMARISGRNQLRGTVAQIVIDGLMAKVVLSIGDQRVTSIITADAVRELDLKPGDPAVALIKATEVMIIRP